MNGIVIFTLLSLSAIIAQAQVEPPNRDLNRSYHASTSERAVFRLTASNQIEGSQSVSYQAGKSVVLLTGFQTRPGASFLASTGTKKMGEGELTSKLTVMSYPNPFIERAIITYQLAEANYTSVYISDTDGRQVKRLVDNQLLESGQHETVWQVDALPSGAYICTVETGNRRISTRLIKR